MKKDVYGLDKPQGASLLTENGFLNRFISVSDFSSTDIRKQKILKTEAKESYPVTYAQKRIYYSNAKLDNESTVNNITFGILFKNKVAPSKIQNTLDKLVQRHSTFRTVFKNENGVINQSILDNPKIIIDIERSSLDIQELIDNFSEPFNLETGPIIRAKIIFLENDSSLVLIDTHKIAIDEISLDIFLKEFFILYNINDITENDLKYIDYAMWEKEFFNSENMQSNEKFWLDKFKNQDCRILNLPYDFSLDTKKSIKLGRTSIELSKDYFESIENIAKENNISSYSIFLACVYVLLYKYTFKSDIIVATPYSGRDISNIQDIVGPFVSNIALNEYIDSNINFIDFAKSINQDILDVTLNGIYPFESLQDKLGLKEQNSLFDIMFTFKKLEPRKYNMSEIDTNIFVRDNHIDISNLEFEISPSQNILNLGYNKTLFKLNTAKSILAHYLYILKQICKDYKCKISEFSMITPEESRLLEKFKIPSQIINDNDVLSIFGSDNKKIKVHILDKDMRHMPIGSFR